MLAAPFHSQMPVYESCDARLGSDRSKPRALLEGAAAALSSSSVPLLSPNVGTWPRLTSLGLGLGLAASRRSSSGTEDTEVEDTGMGWEGSGRWRLEGAPSI